MSPVLSVVMPTYNHAHFLERALQSVINQSFTDWEIIIVDNHSQDNTDEIIDKFRDPRVKFFKINNYGIIAASRNKGINEAKGEWIAFLDSDDWWTSDKLQICINVISENIDFIYHDLRVVEKKASLFNRLKPGRTRQVNKTPLLDMLINGNPISNSSVVVRKILLDDVGGLNENPEMIGAEDFNAWLKIARITNKFLYIPRFLGYYEFHANGVSRKDMSECYTSASNEFIENLDLKDQNQVTAHILYMKGRYFMVYKKISEAKQLFYQSFRMGNFVIRMKSLFLLLFSSFKKG